MSENFENVSKYNFWGNDNLDVGFPRSGYTAKIEGFVSDRVVKVLTGQRRVGKSYILRQIAKSLIDSGVNKNNTFFVNKEYLSFDFVRTYQDLEDLFLEYRRKLSPEGKIYIFLDEVQEINEWERFVNSYSQDCTAQYELFISGSNSRMLSSELGTLLSGRYVEFKIYPFSFDEYASYKGLEKNSLDFVQYMKEGGLPELLKLSGDEARMQYVEGLKNTILLRDVIQRHNVRDSVLLEDLFTYLVNNASKLTSIQNLVNYLASKRRKASYETLAQYIDYLTETFVIHKLERYDIKGKESLGGNFKYYANDTAFHNFLYGGYNYGSGYLLENIVFLDLMRSSFRVYVGVLNSLEVDFVAEKGDRKIYVQVAYHLDDEETIEREYAPLRKTGDSFEKYVVSLDEISLPSKDGIRNIPAWDFPDLLK